MADYEKGVLMVAMWKARGRIHANRDEYDAAKVCNTKAQAGISLLSNVFGKSLLTVKTDVKRVAEEIQGQLEAQM